MPVGDYCRRPVQTVRPDESLREAARRMREEGVGALVVVEPDDRVAGVVTDRDLALRVLQDGADADATEVRALLEREPVLVHADAPLALAAGLMRRRAVRRLPVVDRDEHLVGLVTADDLLRLLSRGLSGLAGAVAAQAPVAGGVVGWDETGDDAGPEVE